MRGSFKRSVGPRFFTPTPQRDPLRPFLFWEIVQQLASGVAFLHSLGEVHRDLKPENCEFTLIISNEIIVLLSPHGRQWVISDFGYTCEGDSDKLTISRAGRGTESYRAPELMGPDTTRFSNKSDIFALGCIIFELASDNKAFANDYIVHYYGNGVRECPKIPTLDRHNSSDRFLSLLIDSTLKVNWWERCSARDIEHEINCLGQLNREIFYPRLGVDVYPFSEGR